MRPLAFSWFMLALQHLLAVGYRGSECPPAPATAWLTARPACGWVHIWQPDVDRDAGVRIMQRRSRREQTCALVFAQRVLGGRQPGKIPVHAACFGPLRMPVQGVPKRLWLTRTRAARGLSSSAQALDSSGGSSSKDDHAAHRKDDGSGQEMGWAAALDARGNPILLENGEGHDMGSVVFDGEEADFQIEADEEFEYGWWEPSHRASPSSVRQDQSDLLLPDVRDIHIASWRDGEMESELGRLEMALSEERAPSLLQLNAALQLCCKAVYKGLGPAGLTNALRILTIMWMSGVAPNARSFDLLLDASVGAAAQENKEALYVALTLVLNMCEAGVEPRVILVNQVIKQVLKATGDSAQDFKLALRIMDAVTSAGVKLDVYSYNSLVAATSLQPDGGSQRALQIMARMRRDNVNPDIVTYNAFLHTCAKGAHVHGYILVRRAWRMLQVLRARPRGLRPSVISYNAVAHSCARAAAGAPAVRMRDLDLEGLARLRSAYNLPTPPKDLSAERVRAMTKTSSAGGDLLAVYARGRLLQEMISLTHMMRQDGVAPDLRSFSTFLHGLARGVDRMVNDLMSVPGVGSQYTQGSSSSHTMSGSHVVPYGRSRRRVAYRDAATGQKESRERLSGMHQHVVELVETLCTAGEDLLVAMGLDHKIRPEATNYRAVLDMYRSAARLGVGRRDWAAAAYWLLRMMRQPGSRVAESAYTDVLEICAAVSERRSRRKNGGPRPAASGPVPSPDKGSRGPDKTRETDRAASPVQQSKTARDRYTTYDSVLEVVMAVVEAMHQDGVPLNHAAVGYVFFATRREGSPRAVELAFGLFLSLEPHLRSKQAYTSMMTTLATLGRTMDILSLLQLAQDEGVYPDAIMYGVCLQAIRNDGPALLEFRQMLLASAELRAAPGHLGAHGEASRGASAGSGANERQGKKSGLSSNDYLSKEQYADMLREVDKSLALLDAVPSRAQNRERDSLSECAPEDYAHPGGAGLVPRPSAQLRRLRRPASSSSGRARRTRFSRDDRGRRADEKSATFPDALIVSGSGVEEMSDGRRWQHGRRAGLSKQSGFERATDSRRWFSSQQERRRSAPNPRHSGPASRTSASSPAGRRVTVHDSSKLLQGAGGVGKVRGGEVGASKLGGEGEVPVHLQKLRRRPPRAIPASTPPFSSSVAACDPNPPIPASSASTESPSSYLDGLRRRVPRHLRQASGSLEPE